MGKISRIVLGCTLSMTTYFSYADVIETDVLVGFGEAKYKSGFTHFDYVNPNAPKYGSVTYGQVGTYDNFNRFASRGVSAAGSGEMYDSLMYSPSDEINAYYPLIAKQVRYSDDYKWLEIDINPKARFHDGEPITAHDVAFTFRKLFEQGVPQYRIYYKDIKSVTAKSDLTVRVEMSTPNREKNCFNLRRRHKYCQNIFLERQKNLAEPLSTPPVGSSAYKVSAYKSGQSVTYELVDDYWAKDLPVNVGRKKTSRPLLMIITVMKRLCWKRSKRVSSISELKTSLSSGPTPTTA
ncbi:ABC transporter substrate-binding protein [Vibrio sinaloensis]|nr:ABC transporter substrate-binding protein [Vibrio sinaloensis]